MAVFLSPVITSQILLLETNVHNTNSCSTRRQYNESCRYLKLETVSQDTVCAAAILNYKWKASIFLNSFTGSLVAKPKPHSWHVLSKHYSFSVALSHWPKKKTAMKRANHCIALTLQRDIYRARQRQKQTQGSRSHDSLHRSMLHGLLLAEYSSASQASNAKTPY